MTHKIAHKTLAFAVHAFTASGTIFGLLALYLVHLHEFVGAFWLMVLTIVIDAVDGWMARSVNVKTALPRIDGALLDNIVDFFTYAILPAYFLLVIDQLVPKNWHLVCAIVIILASCYQFCQTDAKTEDHFFKGFPSYWNIVIFYLFFWDMNAWVNLSIIFLLGFLSFVPIKYVYPSRLDYLTTHMLLRRAMSIATLIWGVSTVGLLWIYPKTNLVFVILSMGYVVLYLLISIYRTFYPVRR